MRGIFKLSIFMMMFCFVALSAARADGRPWENPMIRRVDIPCQESSRLAHYDKTCTEIYNEVKNHLMSYAHTMVDTMANRAIDSGGSSTTIESGFITSIGCQSAPSGDLLRDGAGQALISGSGRALHREVSCNAPSRISLGPGPTCNIQNNEGWRTGYRSLAGSALTATDRNSSGGYCGNWCQLRLDTSSGHPVIILGSSRNDCMRERGFLNGVLKQSYISKTADVLNELRTNRSTSMLSINITPPPTPPTGSPSAEPRCGALARDLVKAIHDQQELQAALDEQINHLHPEDQERLRYAGCEESSFNQTSTTGQRVGFNNNSECALRFAKNQTQRLISTVLLCEMNHRASQQYLKASAIFQIDSLIEHARAGLSAVSGCGGNYVRDGRDDAERTQRLQGCYKEALGQYLTQELNRTAPVVRLSEPGAGTDWFERWTPPATRAVAGSTSGGDTSR